MAEIGEIVAARDAGEPPCAYVRRLLRQQIEATKQQITDLQVLLGDLERLDLLSEPMPDQPSPDETCICHAIECAELEPAT